MPASPRKHRRALLRAIDNAPSREEWFEAASELDRLDGNDAWRADDESGFYDAELLRRHIAELRRLRESRQFVLLETTLTESLYRNLPDISAPQLYDQTHTGETKRLVETYLDEAEAALDLLCDQEVPGLTRADKLRRFSRAHVNFGRTALLLSGGGAWGLFHLGVTSALLEAGLLPTVICGSSMGAIVASGVAVRTDDELREMLDNPERIHRVAVRMTRLTELRKRGSVLSMEQLEEHVHANVGEFTFREAWERTGRILNVSVSPTRARQKPRVLNHLTAPHVLIRDATVASCAIPGLWPPVLLHARDPRSGEVVPYVPTERWVDGSLRGDVPMRRVGRLHNVNHFVVSQANPFVLPFVTRGSHGIVQQALRFGGSIARAQAAAVLDETRRRVHSDRWRPVLDTAHALTGQHYGGDIDIHPRVPPKLYARVMSNPSLEQLHGYIRGGERATWSRLPLVRDQTRVARVLEACIERLGGSAP